jgi:hypothetical protein
MNRICIGIRGDLANGLNLNFFDEFGVIGRLQARLGLKASQESNHYYADHPESAVHGFFLA